ncbi:MAG: hypothetical protein HQL72_04205 [Magnetococcales bacterium]|nr:hypothetical protein [Magnetococcales bacterium]
MADLQASEEQRDTLQARIVEMESERVKLKEAIRVANDEKEGALASVAKDQKGGMTRLNVARKGFRTAEEALQDHDELAQALIDRLDNELGDHVIRGLRRTAQSATETFFRAVFSLEVEQFRKEHAAELDQLFVLYRGGGMITPPSMFADAVLIGGRHDIYGKHPENFAERTQEIETQILK